MGSYGFILMYMRFNLFMFASDILMSLVWPASLPQAVLFRLKLRSRICRLCQFWELSELYSFICFLRFFQFANIASPAKLTITTRTALKFCASTPARQPSIFPQPKFLGNFRNEITLARMSTRKYEYSIRFGSTNLFNLQQCKVL